MGDAVVDTKLNLLVFGTGNPVPWNSRGPGKNLYTDAIVALNLYTGQLVWAFQTAHHDLWDSDLPNNPVAFDAKFKVPVTVSKKVRVKVKGKLVTKTKKVKTTALKLRPAVAEVNKYGMTFILDRETGKPLIPVKEVPVPQNKSPDVNTWPTQPVPQTENVLFNKIGKDGRPVRRREHHADQCVRPVRPGDRARRQAVQDRLRVRPVRHDAVRRDAVRADGLAGELVQPAEPGFITCGVTNRATGFEQIPKASQVAGANGGIGAARLGVGDTSTSNTGNFAMMNVTTGKLTWHQHWEAPCYSGSMNTASGLTFIGHLGQGNAQNGLGYLEAMDTKTGKSLWTSPLMTAPVGAAPVTYMVGGKQYVSVAVGGQSHNDVSRPKGLTNPARLRDDTSTRSSCPSASSERGGGHGRRPALCSCKEPAPSLRRRR